MKRTAIIVALVALAALVAPSPLGPPNVAAETHTFECGTDEPPSGPYLNTALDQIFEYDCDAGTLTPTTIFVSGCYGVSVGSEFEPIAGFCAIANEGSGTHSVSIQVFMATTGNYDQIYSYGHGHSGYGKVCEGTQGTLSTAVVTYEDSACQGGLFNCSPQWFGAHAEASGPTGTRTTQHDALTYACN